MVVSAEKALNLGVKEHLKQIYLLEKELGALQAKLSSYREGMPELTDEEDKWVVCFLSEDFFDEDKTMLGGGPSYDIEKSTGKILRRYLTQ